MILGVVVGVAISVVGSSRCALFGPALGSLANYTLVAIWWLPLLLRRTFGTSIRALARAVAGPALLAVPFTVGLFLLSTQFPVNELAIPVWARWLVLAGGMVVAATVYFVLSWFLVLPQSDRDEFRTRLFRR